MILKCNISATALKVSSSRLNDNLVNKLSIQCSTNNNPTQTYIISQTIYQLQVDNDTAKQP